MGILESAKGFRGGHSKLFRTANQQVMKAQKYAYAGRKKKKISFRRLWIRRINASVRGTSSFTYSTLMHALKKKGILVNRKSLSQLALLEPALFQNLLQKTYG